MKAHDIVEALNLQAAEYDGVNPPCVICGEPSFAFFTLCQQCLRGETTMETAKRKRWTDSEIEFLKKYAYRGADWLAEKLDRKKVLVGQKASSLGISLKKRDHEETVEAVEAVAPAATPEQLEESVDASGEIVDVREESAAVEPSPRPVGERVVGCDSQEPVTSLGKSVGSVRFDVSVAVNSDLAAELVDLLADQITPVTPRAKRALARLVELAKGAA